MNKEKLSIAKVEARRFLAKIKELESLPVRFVPYEATADHPAGVHVYISGEGKANGAIKRSSLDLSCALAYLRKP